jgi:LytS/YehU family sensor histidine kinase
MLAATLGCLAGWLASQPFHWAWRTWVLPDPWPNKWYWANGATGHVFWSLTWLLQWLPVGGALVFLHAHRRAARRTARLLHAAELDRIRHSRVALESRLQAMQARIEPQFLFNTLAQVAQLYRTDAALAGRMLEDLIAYLRAAMPLMRDTSSTVGQEVELARAYLDIVRLRLGDRLRVSINVPAEVRNARMPPMMLLPLIDHAVVRGLEPATADGTIGIAARIAGGRLMLTIEDHGVGVVPETEGDGVAAIRQRLEPLYRGEAKLNVRRAGPRATEAILDLPLEVRDPIDDAGRAVG